MGRLGRLRTKILPFFAAQLRCLAALETHGRSHHRARKLARFGHDVRLIPPACVKPLAKRQKNDAADAEAICEARRANKIELGRISKRSERTLRRLLIIGASAVVQQRLRASVEIRF